MTLRELHDAAERLTGDGWCPYPSDLMLRWADTATDEELSAAILKRRTFAFPYFLAGEPQAATFRDASREA